MNRVTGFYKGLYYEISNYESESYCKYNFSVMDYGIITKRQIILDRIISQNPIILSEVTNWIDDFLNNRNQIQIDIQHNDFVSSGKDKSDE